MSHIPEAKISLRPGSFVAGNVPQFDASGNPADSGDTTSTIGDPSLLAFDGSQNADFAVAAGGCVYNVLVGPATEVDATLPPTASVPLGKVYKFRKDGPGTALIILPNAADLPVGGPADGINGASSLSLAAERQTVELVCVRQKVGAAVGAWAILSAYTPPA